MICPVCGGRELDWCHDDNKCAEKQYEKVDGKWVDKYKKPWETKRMELNEYQKEAKKTANFHGCMDHVDGNGVTTYVDVKLEALVYCSLGLTGEAGEVVENTKKLLRDDQTKLTEERRQKFLGELGDVLWYLANLSDALGYSLEDVAAYNLQKLQKRYNKPVGPPNWEFKDGQQPKDWKKVE